MRRISIAFVFAAGLLLAAPLSGQPVQDVILLTSGSSSSSSSSGVSLANWLREVEPETVVALVSPSGGRTSTSVGQLPKLLESAAVGTYQLIIFREEEVMQAVVIVE